MIINLNRDVKLDADAMTKKDFDTLLSHGAEEAEDLLDSFKEFNSNPKLDYFNFDEDSQGDLLVKIDQTKFDDKPQIIDLVAACLSDFAWSEYSAYTMAEDLPINEDDYCEKAKAEFYRALTRQKEQNLSC